MNLIQLGHEIRRFRRAKGLTQAELASAAGVTRTTLNQLENGVIGELGIRKVQAILAELGLELAPFPVIKARQPNFLRLASTAASVSFEEPLTERELMHMLLTGRVPADRRPHIRVLLEEVPPAVREGLIQQVSSWTRPGKVEENIRKLAATVGLRESS